VVAWKEIQVGGEQITVEVDAAIDLSGGPINGLFLCRVRDLTAFYVREGSTDGDSVLVSAPSPEGAIGKIKRAIEGGRMVRRKPVEFT